MHRDPYLPESNLLSSDERAWYRDEHGWNCDPFFILPRRPKLFQARIRKR